MPRPKHLRPEPLDHSDERVIQRVGDHPNQLKVYSAPGYLLFIEKMWHGNFQQVPVDPEQVPALIEALQAAVANHHQEEIDNAPA